MQLHHDGHIVQGKIRDVIWGALFSIAAASGDGKLQISCSYVVTWYSFLGLIFSPSE